MTIKTGFTLATGNTFVYFVQPVFADATRRGRSSSGRCGPLDRSWPGSPRTSTRSTPRSPHDPRIRRLFRRLTLLWGLVIVVKGSVTLWLLVSLVDASTSCLIKSSAILILTLTAAAATVALSASVGRQEGLVRPAGSAQPRYFSHGPVMARVRPGSAC